VAVAGPRLIGSRFPYLPITLRIGATDASLEALLDTGFSGYAAVPPAVLDMPGPPDAWLQYGMADGSVITAPAYRGQAQLGPFGPFRVVITVLGTEVIVGRALMDRFLITLERGNRIIVEP
jgi:predicted aspartyl protease